MSAPPFPTVRVADLPALPTAARWLVSSLWAEAGVGVLGGHPKSCKTWLALDLATSVASGSPCLERFPVPEPGPVLVYLAEDSLASARSRIGGIAARRGLPLARLDLHLLDRREIRLDQTGDLERLAATLEALRPRLLVLDPLVRLHRLDENHAADMSRILCDLRSLERRFEIAILLVHHSRKNGGGRPGQALRGSSDLWAWGDSNAYLSRDGDLLTLTLEHRQHEAIPPLRLRLDAGTDGAHLVVDTETPHLVRHIDLVDRVIGLLHGQPPLTRARIRSELAVNNHRLGQTLERLADQGRLLHHADGWALAPRDRSVPHPTVEPERNDGPPLSSAAKL